MKQVGDKYGTTIHLSLAQNERAAPRTDPESRVVQLLMEQVRQVLNVEPRVYGIGGGTCAAYFRKKGFDAAVWSKFDESAHSANEYAIIQNIVEETKVFAMMILRA
jgi:succinyl-diaminopimelate desuccinylase